MTVNPTAHPSVATSSPNELEHRRAIAATLNNVMKGKINASLDVTLTANAASTTLTDARIGYQSAIVPAMPKTSNGAACLAAGIYVDTIVTGSCIVHHRNNAATDQTIRFLILG